MDTLKTPPSLSVLWVSITSLQAQPCKTPQLSQGEHASLCSLKLYSFFRGKKNVSCDKQNFMCCSLLIYAHLIFHSNWNTIYFFYHSTQVRFEVIYANDKIFASLKTLKAKTNKVHSVMQVLNLER